MKTQLDTVVPIAPLRLVHNDTAALSVDPAGVMTIRFSREPTASELEQIAHGVDAGLKACANDWIDRYVAGRAYRAIRKSVGGELEHVYGPGDADAR